MEDNWVMIFSSPDEVRATIACQTLQEEGIKAVIINRKDSATKVGDAELYVMRDDESRAKEVIKEFTG